MRRTTRLVVPVATVGALLALSLTFVAGPAQAHDALVSTNPADQAQIQAVPDSILLTFEEPAEQVGSQVIVRGPSGADLAQGPPVFVKNTVTQAVQPGAPAGKYTVLWRVTSDDGHPVSGQFTFTAASAGTTATAEGSASTSPSSSSSAVTSPSPTAPTSSQGSAGSSAPRWLWLLILLALLVPVAIFVRRRPGGPHDASPGGRPSD